MPSYKTLAFSNVGDLAILYESGESHPDSEWNAWLEFVGPLSNTKQNFKLLVYSNGGGPTPLQRKKSVEVMPRKDIPIAVLTNATLIRGVVTAYSWVSVMKIKAFKLLDFDKALDYLEIPKTKKPLCTDALNRLKTDIIINNSSQPGIKKNFGKL